MSILRSPLLILGILLILLAGALGVGPLLIDWNGYKADFQRQASLMLGRQVVISGPISVRLFPWPRLTASNITVANPPGAMLANLVNIEKVDAEIAAAPLLSGQISLQKLTLVRPVVSLERLASGQVSWKLDPAVSLSGLPGGDQIAVSGIDIIDGRIFVGDGRRGGLSQLNSVQGRLKAPALGGPWRADITATQADSPLAITVSTSKYRPGEPLKVSTSISPRGDSGFLWAFDGETLRDDGKVTGKVTLRPANQPNGKANPLNANWQVHLTGDVVADFDKVELTNIEVVPANDITGTNLLTGSASVDLGSHFVVTTKLEAATIDLDDLIGGNLFTELSTGEQLYTVSDLLGSLPANSQIHFETSITSLITGGETLSKTRLRGDISPQAMRIKEASASLPGQTRAEFAGVVLPAGTNGLPQLAGELKIQSRSLRELVIWATPDSAEETRKVWSGTRGRANLRTLLGWTPNSLRMTGVRAQLDDANATGSFSLYHGEEPSLDLRLIADAINVDRYAPRGFSSSAIKDGTAAGLTNLAANALDFGDAHITIQTDSLIMRGVEAQDIAIDVDLSAGAVELRTIEIGGIGDARLDIAGVLNFPEEGIAGSVSGDFKASDPRPFLRLIGVLDPELASAPWAKRLGPVDLNVLSEASTGSASNKLTVSANGTAAGASISLSGSFDGQFSRWRDGDVQVTASATGTSSANLLALAGLEAMAGGGEAGELKVALAGKPSAALAGTAEVSLLSSTTGFDGGVTFNPSGAVSAEGKIKVEAEDISSLATAIGVAVPAWPDQIDRKFSFSASTDLSGDKISLGDINATMPFNTVTGDASVTGGLKAPLIDARLKVQNLDVGWLATGLVMPAGLDVIASSTTFDATRLDWINEALSIEADRLVIMPGLALGKARAAIERQDETSVSVGISGHAEPDNPFAMTMTASKAGPLLSVNGNLEATVALPDLLQTTDGKGAIQGDLGLKLNFAGEGRSPAGLVSQLTGDGRVVPGDLTLPHFDLPGLTRTLAKVENVDTIDDVISSALASGSTILRSDASAVALLNGTLRTEDVPISSDFANGRLRLSADFSAQRVRADISLKQQTSNNEMPSISMRLGGHPLSLERSYDTSALKSWIVVSVLQKGMDRLEELQREEQRLIEEEQRFREEQAAREAERLRKAREEQEAKAAAEEARQQAIRDAREREESERREQVEQPAREEQQRIERAEQEAREELERREQAEQQAREEQQRIERAEQEAREERERLERAEQQAREQRERREQAEQQAREEQLRLEEAEQKAREERERRERAEQLAREERERRERAEQQAREERERRERAEQQAREERERIERAEQQAREEQLRLEQAAQEAREERERIERAEQQAREEQLRREQAEQEAREERERIERAEQQAREEQLRREQAEQEAREERERIERAEQQAREEQLRREQAEQEAREERERIERAEQQAREEQLRREQAEQEAREERERIERAEQQAREEQLRREQAEQEASEEQLRLEQAEQEAREERERKERAEQQAREEQEANQAAMRRALEEIERRATEEQQQRLKDLIEQNISPEIPPEAIIGPQNSRLLDPYSTQPLAPQ